MKTHHRKPALLATPAFAALLLLGACADEEPEYVQPEPLESARVETPAVPPTAERPATSLRAGAQQPVDAPDRGGAVAGGAGPFEAIRVVHTTPDQVRVGEPHPFQLVVTNTTSEPLRGVVVRHVGGDGYQILEVGEDRQRLTQQQGQQSAQQQGQQTAQQQGERQQGQQQGQRSANGQREGSAVEASARREGGPQGQQGQQGQQQGMGDARAFQIGTLQPNETRTIEGRAVANQEGRLDACLTVEFQPVICTTIEAVQPELRLARQLEEQAYYICEEIPVLYAVANTGSGDSPAVTIQHPLPEGLRTAEGQDRVQLDVGPIEPGQTVERTVRLTAQRGGEFTIGSELSLDDSSVRIQELALVVMEPQLEVSIDGPPQEYLGRTLTYQVQVRNTSEHPALETAVRVVLPEGVDRPTVSSRNLGDQQDEGIFQIGTLAAGESRSFALRFEPGAPTQVQLEASAKALCAEAAQDSITTEVVGIPAILLEVVDRNDPVAVGETTTYEIRVKNQGTAPGLNIQVQAELPAELEFVSGDGTTQVQAEGRNLRFGPIERVEPGDVVGWDVQVRATSEAMTRFRVELRSDAQNKPVFELEPTTLFGSGKPGLGQGQDGEQRGQQGQQQRQQQGDNGRDY